MAKVDDQENVLMHIDNKGTATKILSIDPPEVDHSMVFYKNNEKVSKLSWNTGRLEFEGDADHAALLLFDFLRGYIDRYIREQIDENS
jgi:hypothetical protein